MMAQARQLPVALQTRISHSSEDWTRLRNHSLCLKGGSVVILGFGSIAARLVELLAPFEMKIRAMRRQPKGNEGVPTFTPGSIAIPPLAEADHVVNVLPENAESKKFVNAERLGWMKPGAIFYNIGRGATVDQTALLASLQSGHLAAAWLDVTDPEPLPDGHPLFVRAQLLHHAAHGGRPWSRDRIARPPLPRKLSPLRQGRAAARPRHLNVSKSYRPSPYPASFALLAPSAP